MDAAAYARQLKQLLPPGALWGFGEGSWLSKALLAVADELARIDTRAQSLQDEWDPRTALETLDDWERVLGLPDDCLTTIPSAASERQAAITNKLTSRGGQSRQYFIDLAAGLGYTVTITEYALQVARAGRLRAGEPCYGEAWSFAWQVNLPISPEADVRFRAGQGRAGDPLSGYTQLDIQCIIQRAAPAHTVVLFGYT